MTEPRGDLRPPPIVADEKATLHAFLRYLREAVIAKLDGLSEEQARMPGVQSGTSLMWLVKHLRTAELNWFVWAYTAEVEEMWDRFPAVTDGDTVADLVAAYRAASRRVDDVIDACADLNAPGPRIVNDGEPAPTLRWILVHTIEETARHAGHADILREQIDGTTGR